MQNSPLKIYIAIPTFNRLQKLQVLLSSIAGQIGDESYRCTVVISNSYSNDGTFEFVESIAPYGAIADIVKFNRREGDTWTMAENLNGLPNNWDNLFHTVPLNAEWVWLMGDDDYLVTPTILKNLASIILAEGNESVSLFHLVQARRSKGSKKVERANLIDASEKYGYLELLGWMSSVVFRGDLLSPIFKRRFYDKEHVERLSPVATQDPIMLSKVSAFRHAGLILKACAGSDIVIVDDYFAEPQDEEQTKESIERWQSEFMGLRYMFVIDEIEYLRDVGILTNKLSANFFRYHNQFLWDRFTHQIVAHLCLTGELNEHCIGMMERIAKIEGLLRVPSEVHLFRLWRSCFFSSVEDLIKSRRRYLESCDKLEQMVRLSFKGVFSFDTLF